MMQRPNLCLLLVPCIYCEYMLYTAEPHCLTPAYSPTWLSANPAPASETQRQRALITLVLRGLTGSIESLFNPIQSQALANERKKKTDREERDKKAGKDLCFCFVFFSSKWNWVIDLSSEILGAPFSFQSIYCILILAFTVVWLCQSPPFLSSSSFHLKCLPSFPSLSILLSITGPLFGAPSFPLWHIAV